MSSFGEYVDYRKRTRHKLESRWSRGVFVGVRVKTTERTVMDETGTHGVQSVRRVPEEQRYDHRSLQHVRGTPWEPNPGDVSTDLNEPMLIIPQLPDVAPAPTKTYHSDNRGPAMSKSVKQTLKSLATRQDAQPAQFTAPDCRCLGKDTHHRMQETT